MHAQRILPRALARALLACPLVACIACDAEGEGEAAKAERSQASPPPGASNPGPAPAELEAEEPIRVALPPGDSSTRRARRAPTPADFGPRPGAGENLGDCRTRCKGAALSEDDRATCGLLCDAHYKQDTRVGDNPLVATFFGCFDTCEGAPDCARACATRGEPCPRRCLASLAACLEPCAGPDEARCAERCETTARSCVNRCE